MGTDVHTWWYKLINYINFCPVGHISVVGLTRVSLSSTLKIVVFVRAETTMAVHALSDSYRSIFPVTVSCKLRQYFELIVYVWCCVYASLRRFVSTTRVRVCISFVIFVDPHIRRDVIQQCVRFMCVYCVYSPRPVVVFISSTNVK